MSETDLAPILREIAHALDDQFHREELLRLAPKIELLVAEHAALKQRIEAMLDEMADPDIRAGQSHWFVRLQRALIGA